MATDLQTSSFTMETTSREPEDQSISCTTGASTKRIETTKGPDQQTASVATETTDSEMETKKTIDGQTKSLTRFTLTQEIDTTRKMDQQTQSDTTATPNKGIETTKALDQQTISETTVSESAGETEPQTAIPLESLTRKPDEIVKTDQQTSSFTMKTSTRQPVDNQKTSRPKHISHNKSIN